LKQLSEEEEASYFSQMIRQAKLGDRGAFDAMERKCRPRICSLCHRLLGHESQGDDAAQEAFLKAWASLGTFGSKGAFNDAKHEKRAFERWVVLIARHHCFNILRGKPIEIESLDLTDAAILPLVRGFEGEVIDAVSQTVPIERLRRTIWECEKESKPRWDPLTVVIFHHYYEQAVEHDAVKVEVKRIAEIVGRHRETVTDRLKNRIWPVVAAALARMKEEDDAD
jgi:DNA-directed RNA polymerase specialized sigma24 family protein